MTHAQTQRYSLFLAYRIFSIKRRGVCFEITFLKSLTTVTVNRFLHIMYLKRFQSPSYFAEIES